MSTYELYILRHAKSDWDTDAPTDFQRPLNKRGITAVEHFEDWLPAEIHQPVLIISSPALRAWQTAVAASQSLRISENEILFSGKLYLASEKDILHFLSQVDEEIKSVLLVGHNPGLEDLIGYLVSEKLPNMTNGKILPTATLAHIKLTKNWQHLCKGAGKLQKIYLSAHTGFPLFRRLRNRGQR